DDVVNDALVEVFTAQEGITVGGQHFELLLAIDVGDFNDGDVKGTAAQVVNHDLAVALFGFIHAKGQRSRCRLVDDALDIQTGNAARILGSLTLAVIKVSGYGDHSLG